MVPVDRRRLRPFRFALLSALAVIAVALPSPAAEQAGGSCDIEGVERIVAVGDVHGAYAGFVAILQVAGVIDGQQRWSGGRTHLVQTGDVVDRGPDSRKAIELLRRLEGDAAHAGGRVHALLGNHEVMRMLGDMRYVSPGEYAAFRAEKSETMRERFYRSELPEARKRAEGAGQRFDEKAFRERFMAEVPLGQVELRVEFGRDGEYGRWLRRHDAMAKINGFVFLHGGVSPAVAALGCRGVNETASVELNSDFRTTRASPVASLVGRPDGPLWYRGLAQEPEADFAPKLEAILSSLGAKAIVVGHTVASGGRILTRFGGKVVQIDTGMQASYQPGGRASALEIRDGRLTAIYEDRRDELPELTPVPGAAAR